MIGKLRFAFPLFLLSTELASVEATSRERQGMKPATTEASSVESRAGGTVPRM